MTAREYLMQVQYKEAKIRNLRRDKEGIQEMLFSLGGGATDSVRVQTSKNHDKFGSLYARIDEMEREIDAKIEELMLFKLKVSREINEIQNAKYMNVLNCRYIHFMKWEDIAEKGFDVPYTVRHIQKVNGLALVKFQEKHKEMLKEVGEI